MARISFETMVSNPPESGATNTPNNNVSFFALKNDGDMATVRILHDSVADFDIITSHNINLNGKVRKVACVRDPREPVENCPLCAQNSQVWQRIYIHMIEYVKTPDNQIIAKPVVWERSAYQYGNKLKSLIEEYGPLSDCIFRVKRNGKAGDMQTDYEIMFGNPSIYPDTLYGKDPAIMETFKNYSALGTVVLNKNYNEINEFIATGNFSSTNASKAAVESSGTAQYANAQVNTTETYATPVNTPMPEVTQISTPNNNPSYVNNRMPWENPGAGQNINNNFSTERPVRNRTY